MSAKLQVQVQRINSLFGKEKEPTLIPPPLAAAFHTVPFDVCSRPALGMLWSRYNLVGCSAQGEEGEPYRATSSLTCTNLGLDEFDKTSDFQRDRWDWVKRLLSLLPGETALFWMFGHLPVFLF